MGTALTQEYWEAVQSYGEEAWCEEITSEAGYEFIALAEGNLIDVYDGAVVRLVVQGFGDSEQYLAFCQMIVDGILGAADFLEVLAVESYGNNEALVSIYFSLEQVAVLASTSWVLGLLIKDQSTRAQDVYLLVYEPAELDLSLNFESAVFDNTAQPLPTPTGLYADNITSDSARTNWQAVENASNYKVQYKAAGDTVWTETYTD